MLPASEFAIARARARESADERLRGQIDAWLLMPETLRARGRTPKGRFCAECRRTPRYPDHRCASHTAYLIGDERDRRAADSSERDYLGLWRSFLLRIAGIVG